MKTPQKLILSFFCFLLVNACSHPPKAPPVDQKLVQKVTASTVISPEYIRYLVQQKQLVPAIIAYQNYASTRKEHDFALIKQMCLQIIKQGLEEMELEPQLLTIYGAGITQDESNLSLLSRGLSSRFPEVQLSALAFLYSYHNEAANYSLLKGLRSPFPIVNLETLYYLALNKSPHFHGEFESFLGKIPPFIKPAITELFAISAAPDDLQNLKQLLYDQDLNLRLSSIKYIGLYDHTSLQESIQLVASDPNPAIEEAAATTLGMLMDRGSISLLQKLVSNPSPYVQIASSYALYTLGKLEAKTLLEKQAFDNVFAITLLGNINGNDDLLISLLESSNPQIKGNAAIALLKRKHPAALPYLKMLLTTDSQDLGIYPQYSPGMSLQSWKFISSAQQQSKLYPNLLEISLQIREQFLKEALNLPEENFLDLAKAVLESSQKALVPTLIGLLENLRTEAALDLLKESSNKFGSPLVRNYSNLALFRIYESEAYLARIKQWLEKAQKATILRFRAMAGRYTNKQPKSPYQLAPEETSQLLISVFQTLATKQTEYTIDMLLQAIKDGHPNNKYAIAGLLFHIVE